MLNGPRAIERDNQNGLRKFPFSDAASCTTGAGVIVPGAIIDAQLCLPSIKTGRVWMSSVGSDGKIVFSDETGVCCETVSPIRANSAIPVVYTGEGGPLPAGVVVCGDEASVSAVRSLGGQEFTADQAELAPAAVSWMGLPGVSGFVLDDGNIVSGDVKIKGHNGCEVSTYVNEAGENRLRISAVGATVETIEATGYITKVIAESDNTNFTVSRTRSGYVIDILATGVRYAQDGGLSADQFNVCEAVKKARGTSISASATVPPDCSDNVCNTDIVQARTITFMDGLDLVGGTITVFDGGELGTLDSAHMPDAGRHPGERFIGYFDKQPGSTETADMRLYYRFNGEGVGRLKAESDVTLYAHWMPDSSSAEVVFDGYGTLHLAAPDVSAYTNPVKISGDPSPIPVVTEIKDDVLKNGGAEALAEIVMHPTVPAGTVTIGLRGLEKAYSL